MIKTKRNKRGAGHVDVIVSFVIFTSFIIFLLIYLNPLKNLRNITDLDITKNKILDYISVEFSVTSLTLNSSFMETAIVGDCFYFSSSLPDKIIIEDESLNAVEGIKTDGRVYFKYTGERFYRIYSSEELEERALDITSCTELEESDYTLGVARVYKKVSSSKLNDFFSNYNENYGQLKKNLGLINNFNVIVETETETFKAEKYKPETEIMARTLSIEILDENAGLKPAIINIRVWD